METNTETSVTASQSTRYKWLMLNVDCSKVKCSDPHHVMAPYKLSYYYYYHYYLYYPT